MGSVLGRQQVLYSQKNPHKIFFVYEHCGCQPPGRTWGGKPPTRIICDLQVTEISFPGVSMAVLDDEPVWH